MDNQDQNQIQQQHLVTSREFAAKFKSKREVYLFLTLDCDAYLPAYDLVSIFWLKDLIANKKKVR